MNPLSTILPTIIPIFGIIALGWIARHFKIVRKQAATSFNSFVYNIALPFLVFLGIIKLDFTDLLNWRLLVTNVLAMLALVVVVTILTKKILKFDPKKVAMFVVAAYFGNVAYIGIAFNEFAFGPEGGALATLVSVVVIVFAILVGLTTLKLVSKEKETKFSDILWQLIKMPLIWAALLGILVVAFGVQLPVSVHKMVTLLAQLAGPLALFSIGMFVYQTHITGNVKLTAALSAFNLLILPLAVFLVGTGIGLTGLPLKVSIIQAGMPVAITNFIFSRRFKIEESKITQMIIFSTLLAPFTLALLLYLVGFL